MFLGFRDPYDPDSMQLNPGDTSSALIGNNTHESSLTNVTAPCDYAAVVNMSHLAGTVSVSLHCSNPHRRSDALDAVVLAHPIDTCLLAKALHCFCRQLGSDQVDSGFEYSLYTGVGIQLRKPFNHMHAIARTQNRTTILTKSMAGVSDRMQHQENCI